MMALCFAVETIAQDQEQKTGRPNIPGTLQFDYGYSFSIANDSVPFKVGGNRTFNAYYYQNFKIGSTKFSFHPGIGLGLDRYKLDEDSVNIISTNIDGAFFDKVEEIDLKKSMFVSNYIDLPIEFRFNSNPNDPRRSFKVALGGKIGIPFQQKSKLKFIENNKTVYLKEVNDFHLSPIRYSTYLRIGGADYYAFVNYSLSPLFKENEGPGGIKINMMTVGFSFNGF